MPITTYTASAGSGKTYALTREYLQLLLAQPATESAYRQLLAITFTNKAAGEMKSRIMERLNSLATAGADHDFCTALSLSPDALQARAMALRSAILHDYSHFSVSTIDAFFQKIVRAFLREMGLAPGFAVELDSERILDEAVDALWQEAAGNAPLRDRLSDLIRRRISNGQSWEARGELKNIGAEVFKESFRSFGDEFMTKIGDAGFLKSYEQTLQRLVDDFTATMRKTGLQALQILQEHDVAVTDFKYKATSFAHYFVKIARAAIDKDFIPGARAMAALHNEEKWLTGNAAKDAVVRTVLFPAIDPLLEKATTCYREHFTAFATARAILKNLYSMALLADVANKVSAIACDENKLLISDTLYLLRLLIGHNDTPFVYEKAGIYYRSFLLDEFQDTSNMQWENLRPLLLNGVSEGGKVWAVGDVKQSIYRWRNGDWRILASGLPDYFSAYGTENIVLDTNWRSKEVVVATNNRLFTDLPVCLQQKLNESMEQAALADNDRTARLRTLVTEAYRATKQKVAPAKINSGGYVQIQCVTAGDAGETTTENTPPQTAKERVLQQLPERIAELQDRGYRASDIAILVRTRREGQEVADALLQYKQTAADTTHRFDVLSPDALFLAHAPVVQFVMAVLNLSVAPGDAIQKTIAERYLQRFRPDEKITATWVEKLLYQPLSEAIETIVVHFRLNERASDWAFLQELHDVALVYANRERNDIFSFVQYWKDAGPSCVLSMSDNRDAIQIFTIHKAKGLQFPVVLLPFCNWSLEPKTNSLLWVKARHEPFSGPGHLPLNCTHALADTLFHADYWEERVQSAIDNLNVLYVAFTRAEEELYVWIPQPSQKRAYSFASLLPELLQTDTYTAGQQQPKTATATGNAAEFTLRAYPSLPYTNRLRVKYANESLSDAATTGMRDYGILMHRAFSYIETAHDVEAAIEKLVEQGVIARDEALCRTLNDRLSAALKQPGVQAWFDGSWQQVLCETDLLLPAASGAATHQLRPDRVLFRNNEAVVVDYKFGKVKQPQHIRQIQNYIETIKKMGYKQVTGYCWYVLLAEIHTINV
jgi:ATP-dependent exoDNAse (exonuclease V) beta subunit